METKKSISLSSEFMRRRERERWREDEGKRIYWGGMRREGQKKRKKE